MSNVTVNKVKQLAGGALYSSDSNHVVTTADQIYDEQRGCYVSEYDFSGNVKSVNGELPDQNGNITLNDKIKTVNGFEPDRFGNIDATNSIFFSLNNNTIACLKNSQRLSTQSQLADLYNELTNIGLNVQAQKYSIVLDSRSEVLDSYLLGDVLIFLFQKFTDYTYQKEQYIQVKLTPAGVLSYEYITKNDVRSLSLSGNSLLVNTNTGQEEIPLPIKDDLITFSLDFTTDVLTYTGDLDSLLEKNTSNIFLNGVQVSSIYTSDSGFKNLEFKNVISNNFVIHPISYSITIQVHDNGVPSLLYKIPNLFYLDLKEDFTWNMYADEGLSTDITDVFIESLYLTTLDQKNIPERIFVQDHNTLQVDHYGSREVYLTLLSYDFKYRYIILNIDNKTYQERVSHYLELQSNKVEVITEDNKESIIKYPSVKALVDYVKDIKPQEETLVATNLSEFLSHAKTISENTNSSKRYRLNINGVIDFSAPEPDDTQAKIKWKGTDLSIYDATNKIWNFEGIFMYTTIIGISANAVLKTTYVTEQNNIDTVTLKLYVGNFENISIGGSAVATDSSGKIHKWSRPLFLGTNNINFKFTNCSFPILGHITSDNSEHCLLFKTESGTSHKGNGSFNFWHTSIKFLNCSWAPGRNKQNFSAGNLANAPILLDFSNNSSSDYYNKDYTRALEIIANIKTARYSDSGDNAEQDLSEIGIPQFYIKGYNNEIWSVSSDAHALVKSDANASIRYFATIQVQDIFLKEAAYTKTNDASFNTNYQLVTYIQDLENRIKTLETRLNTN